MPGIMGFHPLTVCNTMTTAESPRPPTLPRASSADPNSAEQIGGYGDHWWYPRFWYGMATPATSGCWSQNRFQIAPDADGPWRRASAWPACSTRSLWLIQEIRWGRRIARHATPGRPDLRDRPLAVRHHAAARVAGARPAAHLSRHVRLLRAEPFSGLGLVDAAAAVADLAEAAADGQHGGRLGPPAGGRVRPVQHGRCRRPT